MITPSSNIWYE